MFRYVFLTIMLTSISVYAMDSDSTRQVVRIDTVKTFQVDTIIVIRVDTINTAANPQKRNDSTDVWIPTMVTGLNISQIAFSNWTQGGSDALTWTVTADVGLDYRTDGWKLRNRGRVGYGRTKLGSQGNITNDNELFLESVLSYNIGWSTDPFFSNSVRTTLTRGYSYTTNPPVLIADFFDPGYITQSLGFTYDKLKFVSTRLGVAAQEVFANKYRQYTDNTKTTGDVEAFKLETGFESVSQGKAQIANNVLVTSALRLFTRFESLDVWDVRWDNVIAAKVNSFVNVNFNFQLVYEKDQSLTTQMKEGLQLGLTYTVL